MGASTILSRTLATDKEWLRLGYSLSLTLGDLIASPTAKLEKAVPTDDLETQHCPRYPDALCEPFMNAPFVPRSSRLPTRSRVITDDNTAISNPSWNEEISNDHSKRKGIAFWTSMMS
ncbi:hypothetical protein PCASD_25264 [Puccinia coronata f. sp. avenae]|uniref:Uncharacterized protein n=1 Tax=Puccinia coronata f. sp. avenae TaxID=200324 RepID=A0A2N5RWS1_9BASI|nr:hypothetical protein PCASD_25264 [Puccinia coronata f. sp. avenae]